MERRLILSFDDNCGDCAEIATSIGERFGNTLEVRALDDLQVEAWRKQCLGINPQWTPTLIEMNGDKVKAWTGYRMGVALSTRLGPVGTWQLMQALGEFRRSFSHEEQDKRFVAGELGVGITRGKFLTMATKGIAGAVLAAAIMGVNASPAQAASWPRCKRGNFNGSRNYATVNTRYGGAFVHVYNRNAAGGIPVYVTNEGWNQRGSTWVPPLSWRRIGIGGQTDRPFAVLKYRCSNRPSLYVARFNFRIDSSESIGGGLYAIASARCGGCYS